ncbi:DUF3006 domain-containing protein [Bacillus sp. SCS-153A]|uniref:DUF3006 domain-containing protein n=1 Tax=Rossellomorea sedimentorum TaxID=3115294 RepID=UPI0039066103
MNLRNKYTVDRFEGPLAVLLLRNDESVQIDVEKDKLPKELKEGDIIELELADDGSIDKVIILKAETDLARNKAEDLLQKLLNKNK